MKHSIMFSTARIGFKNRGKVTQQRLIPSSLHPPIPPTPIQTFKKRAKQYCTSVTHKQSRQLAIHSKNRAREAGSEKMLCMSVAGAPSCLCLYAHLICTCNSFTETPRKKTFTFTLKLIDLFQVHEKG